MSLSLWLISDAPLTRLFFFFIYGVIVSVGLLLNFYVIFRMLKLARSDRFQFINGTGIFLFLMALCDCVSLFSTFSQFLSNIYLQELSPFVLDVLCKTSEFLTRCMFSQSMYCWLCMSALRYLAAVHPLVYSTVCRSPVIGMICVFIVSLTMNLHISVSIYGDPDRGCVLKDDATAIIYTGSDIVLSFVIPVGLILWMDIRVLCFRAHRKSSDPLLLVVYHKVDEDTERQRLKRMRSFMAISLLVMLIAAPEMLVKSIRMALPKDAVNHAALQIVSYLAKMFYFIKFSVHAFYLTSFVFDRNLLSKASSSRQLSISIRRMEDHPSIVPRARSQTVSFRAMSPVSQSTLTRNNSCIQLQVNSPSPCSELPPNWF